MQVVQNFNRVWDVGTQAWVAMTQPLIDGGSVTLSGSVAISSLPNTSATPPAYDATGLVVRARPHWTSSSNRTYTGATSMSTQLIHSLGPFGGNQAPVGVTIANTSDYTLYITFGIDALSVAGHVWDVEIASHGYYEVPFGFIGSIYGTWATGAELATGWAIAVDIY